LGIEKRAGPDRKKHPFFFDPQWTHDMKKALFASLFSALLVFACTPAENGGNGDNGSNGANGENGSENGGVDDAGSTNGGGADAGSTNGGGNDAGSTNGGGNDAGSTTGGFAGSCTAADGLSCVDFINEFDTPESTQQSCNMTGGTYSAVECTTENLIAICDQPPWKVHYYYLGTDITFGEFSCGQIGGTWTEFGVDGGMGAADGG
jgi:hypothetical protein